jgi:AcrR family transcriptional regulator/DNA-binding XRE family transcriptional regulator
MIGCESEVRRRRWTAVDAGKVGHELRAARGRAGLSLVALGERMGVSAATLSRWETGRGTPTAEALERGAAFLDVDLRHLLRATARRDRDVGRAAKRSASTESERPIKNWRTYEPLVLDPVLAGALREFLRLGYHGTTMRDIARSAGMSVPNVYHYYPSKQAVLVAVMDQTMGEFWRRCDQARAEGSDAAQRFQLLVECFAYFHTYRQEFAFIGASEMRSLEPEERRRIAQIRSDCQHMVDAELRTLDEQGRLGVPHREDAGRAVVTMLVGIANWYQVDGPQRPEQIAKRYVEFADALVGLRAAVE